MISHGMLTEVKNWNLSSTSKTKQNQNNNDLTYLVKCPEKTCSENQLGETGRRINKRVLEHVGQVKKSHMLRHTLQSGHPSVSLNKFKYLEKVLIIIE